MLNFAIRQTARGLRITQLLRQPARLRPLVRAVLYQAVSEYCRGIMPGASILDRFGTRGLVTYGLRHRSAGYVRRQTRDLRLRGPAAFRSPRDLPIRRIVSAMQSLASAKGGAAVLLATSRALTSSAGRPHLQDQITRPGTGHRILIGGNSKATVTITFPAARMLNANPRYADELRDLSLASYRDWVAITARANELWTKAIADLNAGTTAAANARFGIPTEAA